MLERRPGIHIVNRIHFVPSEPTGGLPLSAEIQKQPVKTSQGKKDKIPVGELLEKVRPYPALHAVVLAAMTDEEWQNYVEGLLKKDQEGKNSPAKPEEMSSKGNITNK